MTDIRKASESSPERLLVRGRRTALLFPWLPILAAVDLVALFVAGVISNTAVQSTDPYSGADDSGTSVDVVWVLWLLLLVGSAIFLVWRSRWPFYLRVGPDGIEYHYGRLRATYEWSNVSALTFAGRKHLFGHRRSICLRLADGLGPGVLFAQRLSRTSLTPPFSDRTTGWIVLCDLDRFTRQAAELEASITGFAGPHRHVDR